MKQHIENRTPVPYVRKINPYRPSAKGKTRALEDAEFTKEREWVKGESEKQDHEVAEKINEEEYAENGDGIECGCCFSNVPFVSRFSSCCLQLTGRLNRTKWCSAQKPICSAASA